MPLKISKISDLLIISQDKNFVKSFFYFFTEIFFIKSSNILLNCIRRKSRILFRTDRGAHARPACYSFGFPALFYSEIKNFFMRLLFYAYAETWKEGLRRLRLLRYPRHSTRERSVARGAAQPSTSMEAPGSLLI